MDRIDQIRIFVSIVDHGGFSAAARSLGLSRSIVSKSLIRLEESVGARLLSRSTRHVSATDTGLAFYERCQTLLANFEETMRSLDPLNEQPRGRLRINAPMSFGTLRLADLVSLFMQRYPDVEVELALSDRFVDPIEEGFDITFRIAAPAHSTSLVHHAMATTPRIVCASPAYLEGVGAPSRAQELKHHRCLQYGHHASGNQWRLGGTSYPIRCAMWSNNGEALLTAAIAGCGITLLPEFIAGNAIADGRLVAILPDEPPTPLAISMLYPRHKHLSPSLRLFIDLATSQLNDTTGDAAAAV
ncbi:MAG: LysR substrate-binding domain-containing protein [Pseudomonadota bacterium]